ncbi:unnamed protein product [Psylliodes chrysocephalus]|uniref:Uncharacterized protein n=1 Tax=Psylliodes chrysocephalus TaxID=3402493 RepID=A0A9P0GEZ4_9CUCU|nr:unnamed protein product [Psylliodes chrysocephala]
MIYGLLTVHIRKHVPREKINTFDQLLEEVRKIENIQYEETVASKLGHVKQNTDKSKLVRCSFCHFRGHSVNECRKRLAKFTTQRNTTCTKARGFQNFMLWLWKTGLF